MILEGEDYGLKVGIIDAVHREPGLSVIRWSLIRVRHRPF
jgi:hypothetical protein